MQDPARAFEAHRRAEDILYSQFGSAEKASLSDLSQLLPEVRRKDKLIALRTLQDCFDGKRRVNHWFPVMEKMMHLIIELAADLNEFHTVALRAMEHYKRITQINNAHSLHEVVSKFLAKIKQRIKGNALMKGEEAAVTEDTEQFEVEKMLRGCSWSLASRSLEGQEAEQALTSELSARRQLTTFYNESFDVYRALLNRFRGNLKLSTLFQSTIRECAQMMLDYCEEWQKIASTRDTPVGFPAVKGNLLELLRITRRHIDRLHRSSMGDNMQSAKEIETRRLCLSSQEIFFGYIETWFKLFDIAKTTNLWTEASAAVEAINYTLLEIYPRLQPQPIYIIKYYEALADVFWVSNNCAPTGVTQPQYLYHAFALLQLWKHVSRLPSGTSDKRLVEDLPGRILLAACCVYSAGIDTASESSGFVARRADSAGSNFSLNQGWTQLLGLKHTPNIFGLFRSIQSYNILSHCSKSPELVTFYETVRRSQSSNSVGFLQQTLGMVGQLSCKATYSQYVWPIRQNMTQAVLYSIFKCYHSISLEKLREMCCKPSYVKLEPVLHKVISKMRNKKVIIEVHQAENSCRVVSCGEEELLQASLSRSRVALAEIRQQMEARGSRNASREALIDTVKAGISNERAQILARLDVVERRASATFFEKEAQRKKKLHEKQQKENEQKALATQQLEKERIQREYRKKQEEEEVHAREKIDELISQLEKVTGKAMPDVRCISDRIEVLAAATARLHKEQHRVECEAVEEVNRYDFFIRAKREQETKQVADLWESTAQHWSETAELRRVNQNETRELIQKEATEARERLERMHTARKKWESQIFSARRQALESTRKKRMEEQEVMESLARGAGMQEVA